MPPKWWAQPLIDGIPAVLLALIAAFSTWIIGARLTAGWDMRKKRAELDLQLVQDFNKVVAEFKAIAREREASKAARAARTHGPAEQRPETPASPESVRAELTKRSVAAESSLEAILIKLVSDTEAWLNAHIANPAERASERERQLRIMGLLRVAFRNLRESLAENAEPALGFGDPERWLFNRLTADLGGIIYQRATTPALPPLWQPWRITEPPAQPDSASYLRLMDFRTIDLRAAVAAIAVRLREYNDLRNEARRAGRQINVERLLDPARTQIVTGPGELIQQHVTTIVQMIETRIDDDRRVVPSARVFFEAAPEVAYYLGLADAPPRILLIDRSERLRTLTELDRLPDELPYSADFQGTAPLGLDLLGWSPSEQMLAAIRRVAETPLSRQ